MARGVVSRARYSFTSASPETGLLLLGSITNTAGGLSLPPPAVTWQISNGPELVSFIVRLFRLAPVARGLRCQGNCQGKAGLS
jgi:hypothetical protein